MKLRDLVDDTRPGSRAMLSFGLSAVVNKASDLEDRAEEAAQAMRPNDTEGGRGRDSASSTGGTAEATGLNNTEAGSAMAAGTSTSASRTEARAWSRSNERSRSRSRSGS